MYKYNLGLKFCHIASQRKDSRAILYANGESISYKELDELSNQISHFILKNKAPNKQVIAIFNDKSFYAFACMISCLKLGMPYTNIDSKSPLERIKKMLAFCMPAAIFSNNDEFVNLADKLETQHFNYNGKSFLEDIAGLSSHRPEEIEKVDGNSIAYIMFTSGSTGFPKGVAISHLNLINFVSWAETTFQIKHSDRLTNLNQMHFDNSVFDFYSALFTGASMVSVPYELLLLPRKLIDSFNIVRPTIWFSVPSFIIYCLKMRSFRKDDLSSLRIIMFGGEGFPKTMLRNLADLFFPRVSLVNVYGPTECTCICSSYEVSPKDLDNDELLPLGEIAPNFKFTIDKFEKNSSYGELLLGGPNVGKGYYGDPKRTGESFVQNPLNDAFRDIFYKTGDLVSLDEKKNYLLFHGRSDNQIKRMGYRIELEEIENALGSCEGVEEVVVIFDNQSDDNGSLVAHIAPELKVKTLISNLGLKVPAYMMPDKYLFHRNLKKNYNGKLDRSFYKT